MTQIINSTEGKRLYDLSKFHSALSDDYLTDVDNLQTRFVLQQFFKLDDIHEREKRLALLNISYSLPSLITEKFADYVGQPKTTLDFDLDDHVSALIWGGYTVMIPRLINGEFLVDIQRPDEYILEDDGTERLLTYYYVTRSNNQVDKYILEQVYSGNKIIRTLYKIASNQSYKNYVVKGDVVPLNSIDATKDYAQFETIPNLDSTPLVKVHNRKLKNLKYGTSEIQKVRSLISSIEIEVVNIQDQFLKHLSAKLAIPNSALKIDKDGKVDIKALEVYGMETGDILPSYIINSNPLIDKAFDQIEDFIRQICAILTLPTEFLGLKDGGTAESADTKKIRLASFIKKIQKIRSRFEDAFFRLNDIRAAWTSKVDEQFTIAWPEIFPEDKLQVVNELQIAKDSKLISHVKAIMRYQGIDEEDAIAEKAIIDKESANIDTTQLVN